jgi:hypothetical protein
MSPRVRSIFSIDIVGCAPDEIAGTVAEAEKAGVESAGGKADILQCVSSLAVRSPLLLLICCCVQDRRDPPSGDPREDARPGEAKLPDC